MADLNMRILLSAVGGQQVLSTIGQIGSALTGGGGLVGALGAVALGSTALAIGLGGKAVQAAADFQSQLTALSTGAGESTKNLQMVGDGILNMATQTGTSTKQLTDGMYMVESAGYHGAQGLSVLKAAAEGAKVGNADLGTVANGVTTILTDYHMSASQASNARSALVTTVADGKTHMQDLSSSLGAVLPLASSLHVSFPQVAGGLAVMTNAGMGAQQAAQNLGNTISSLATPSAKAQKSMQSVGLSAQQLKDTLSTQGLSGAIKLVEQHVGSTFPANSVKGITAFKNIMGGTTGYNTALKLGGANMKAYESNIAGISGALNKGKGDVQGWSQVQQDLNFKAAQGKEAMETLGIKVGQILLPYVSKLLDKVIPMVSKFGDWLLKSGALKTGMDTLAGAVSNAAKFVTNMVNFFESHQSAMVTLKVVIIALAGAIGGALVSSIVTMTIAAWAAVPALWAAVAPMLPFIAIGALVALVIAGIVLAIQHWGEIAHWLQGVWAPIGAFFSNMWKGIQQALGNVGGWFKDRFADAQKGVKSGWDNVTGFFKGVGDNIHKTWQTTTQNVVKAFSWLYDHNYYFKNLCDFIRNVVQNVVAWLQGAWTNVTTFISTQWDRLVGFATGLWNNVSTAIQAAVNFVWGWLQGIWSNVSSWLNSQWGRFAGFAQNAWNNVVSVFQGVWGNISGALSGLWNNLSGWFSNLASQAIQWGANIINSLASGITNAAGAVGDAVSGVAKNIASFLGFHSPAEQGPGADADKWMPNLINMLSHSLMVNSPQLGLAAQYAALALATPLATGFSADPSTRADQLSFTTAPSMIYKGKSKPHETTAVKKEEAEDKKEARKAAEEKKKEAHKLAEEHKKEAHKAAAAEKKHVHVVINEIKHELHIHNTNAKLTKEQIHEINEQGMREFGKKLGDEIRAQFGNV